MRYQASLTEGISDTPHGHTFRCELDSFQGPLDLLVALVKRHEIDVFRVMLRDILTQVQQAHSLLTSLPLDAIIEALALSAMLMLLKTRGLTAHKPEEAVDAEGFSDGLIEHLIAYCHIKVVANQLGKQFEERSQCRTRPPSVNRRIVALEPRAPSIEEPMEAQELIDILKKLLAKQAIKQPKIVDESWSLNEALGHIEQQLQLHQQVSFDDLCTLVQQKDGWIVLFLAVLELLKRGASFAVEEHGNAQHFYLCR